MKKITAFKADMLLLIVALLWGSGFVLTKFSLSSMSANQLLSIRFIFGVFILFIINIKRFKNINFQIIKGGIITGIFLTLGFMFQTYGMVFTTASKASFITGLNVIIVPFLYWIISKKKPDIFSFIAVFIATIGMAFLTLDFSKGFSFQLGDTLIVFCAIAFACHIVSTGYFAKDNDVMLLSFFQLLTATVITTLVTIFKEGVNMNLSPLPLLTTIYLGIIVTGIAFLIQAFGQKYTTATHAALILCTESVFGSIFAVIFLKEVMTPMMVLGCFIIFLAIVTAETKWGKSSS